MAPTRKTRRTASKKARSGSTKTKPATRAAKRSTQKAGSSKAVSRKTGSKKAGSKKAAPKKAAAPKPPSQGGPAGRRAPAIRSKKPKKGRKSVAPPPAMTGSGGRASTLGRKWACFSCGAKFYDLNHPEPLCPRCGADQRQKPKESSTPSPPPPPKKPREVRSLAPYLDDDDGTTREEPLSTEELDFELGGLDDAEDLETPDLELGIDEEEPAEED